MFSRRNKRGFTLLEVILAVAIVATVAMSMYRFLELNLAAISASTTRSGEQSAIETLVATLQDQMNKITRREQGALMGEAHKFHDRASDEMTWVGNAGNGLFTRNATGDFKVTLALRPVEKSDALELGLRRIPAEIADQTVGEINVHWLHLLDNVTALEIRYFEPRQNAWFEKWTDPQSRPALVRMRIWRTADPEPYEVILKLPATAVLGAADQPAIPTVRGQPGTRRPRQGQQPNVNPQLPRVPRGERRVRDVGDQ